MDKLKMHSPDITQQNIDKLLELFPNCKTEKQDDNGELSIGVDFDLLKQELSKNIVEGPQERYQLNWPGKKEALLTANAPIAKTLRPCREESVNFDTTENLFIEGDNLDALKLLQETYLGKVKMIYIDPPYNRKKGNDLIYRDDFTGNTYEYLVRSNHIDSEGRQLESNPESNGRFHSDWLSMMFQRLRLSKNLLADDGVVFISIDDNETHNVCKLCDEIFGEENFVGTIIWKNVTDNNPTNVAVEHESIHVYSKSILNLEGVWKSKLSEIKDALEEVSDDLNERFEDTEELQAEYTKWFRENKSQLGPLDRYKYIDKGGVYTGSQSVHNPGKDGYRYDVLHPVSGEPCKQPLMGYRFPESTMRGLLNSGKILFGDNHDKIIELKVYAKDYADKLSSVFELDGRTGPYDLKTLFPEAVKVFSNPKPVALLERLISFVMSSNQIGLDMFAGSSTFSHAVLKLNATDNGLRKFISLQFPEIIDGKSKDSKLALEFCKKVGMEPLISNISKERVRRVGKKINEERLGGTFLDTGFRVLKIDSSNMNDVHYRPDAVSKDDLFNQVEHIKTDRSSEDLLFQVMLDWGVDLSLPIRKEVIEGKEVYFVNDDDLIACFDKDIDEALIKALAAKAPLRVVFRDDGFVSDSVKINVEQIFKQLAPATDIKAI
tara:strand:- start:3552 stop:5540 length:1989 start_codon:yes stop_codon:yes gene_type:complete